MNFPDCKFSNSGIARELVWGDIIFPLQAGLAERRNDEKIAVLVAPGFEEIETI